MQVLVDDPPEPVELLLPPEPVTCVFPPLPELLLPPLPEPLLPPLLLPPLPEPLLPPLPELWPLPPLPELSGVAGLAQPKSEHRTQKKANEGSAHGGPPKSLGSARQKSEQQK